MVIGYTSDVPEVKLGAVASILGTSGASPRIVPAGSLEVDWLITEDPLSRVDRLEARLRLIASSSAVGFRGDENVPVEEIAVEVDALSGSLERGDGVDRSGGRIRVEFLADGD